MEAFDYKNCQNKMQKNYGCPIYISVQGKKVDSKTELNRRNCEAFRAVKKIDYSLLGSSCEALAEVGAGFVRIKEAKKH